jgi:hypothetical protein
LRSPIICWDHLEKVTFWGHYRKVRLAVSLDNLECRMGGCKSAKLPPEAVPKSTDLKIN